MLTEFGIHYRLESCGVFFHKEILIFHTHPFSIVLSAQFMRDCYLEGL